MDARLRSPVGARMTAAQPIQAGGPLGAMAASGVAATRALDACDWAHSPKRARYTPGPGFARAAHGVRRASADDCCSRGVSSRSSTTSARFPPASRFCTCGTASRRRQRVGMPSVDRARNARQAALKPARRTRSSSAPSPQCPRACAHVAEAQRAQRAGRPRHRARGSERGNHARRLADQARRQQRRVPCPNPAGLDQQRGSARVRARSLMGRVDAGQGAPLRPGAAAAPPRPRVTGRAGSTAGSFPDHSRGTCLAPSDGETLLGLGTQRTARTVQRRR